MSNYGTPGSPLLAKIREKGFNPIAITVMICEETFVFRTDKEAHEAFKVMKTNEGWWYGMDGKYPWETTLKEYREQFYPDGDNYPIVYDLI